MGEIRKRLESGKVQSQRYALWLLKESPEEFSQHAELVLDLIVDGSNQTEELPTAVHYNIGIAIHTASLHHELLSSEAAADLLAAVDRLLASADPRLSATAFFWLGRSGEKASYAWENLRRYLSTHKQFDPSSPLSYSAAAVRAMGEIDPQRMLAEKPLEALMEYESVLVAWRPEETAVGAAKESLLAELANARDWIAVLRGGGPPA